MKREEGVELGMELERCFLLFVSFDLLLCGGNTGGLMRKIRVGKRGGNRATWRGGP
jgi:hypothetical protein